MSLERSRPDPDEKGIPWSARRAFAGLAGLAVLLLTALATAQPARAESAFRDGFEHELGRIAAHHVAGVGALVLHVAYAAHDHHVGPRAHRHAHRAKHHAVRHHRAHAVRHRVAHGRAHRRAHRHHGGRCELGHPGKGHRRHWRH